MADGFVGCGRQGIRSSSLVDPTTLQVQLSYSSSLRELLIYKSAASFASTNKIYLRSNFCFLLLLLLCLDHSMFCQSICLHLPSACPWSRTSAGSNQWNWRKGFCHGRGGQLHDRPGSVACQAVWLRKAFAPGEM